MSHLPRKRHIWILFTLFSALIILGVFFGLYVSNDDLEYNIALNPLQPDSGIDEEPIPIEIAEPPVEKILFEYIEIKNSCNVHFEGECVVARSGPGVDFPVVLRVRNQVVLRVDGTVETDGQVWYKVIFDEYVRYPDRLPKTMYIAAEYVNVLLEEGEKTTWDDGNATTSKQIIIDRKEQKLFAYDGDTLFMEVSVSTGLLLSPTPIGTFSVFKKTPSRYMQGPLPGFTDIYDLPGVPWNLYFTESGAVIHGAYWHESFGTRYSHGCVNLSPQDARKLYTWAELGTKVIVKN